MSTTRTKLKQARKLAIALKPARRVELWWIAASEPFVGEVAEGARVVFDATITGRNEFVERGRLADGPEDLGLVYVRGSEGCAPELVGRLVVIDGGVPGGCSPTYMDFDRARVAELLGESDVAAANAAWLAAAVAADSVNPE